MTQIEFDQEILKLREERKGKLNPLYDRLKDLDRQSDDLHVQMQKANLCKLELNMKRKEIRNEIADIERTYREKQWLMNRELNEHKLEEKREEA